MGWLDETLAPYSARRFENVVTRFGHGSMAVAAIVGFGMLLVGLVLLISITLSGVQRLYLMTAGIETSATIVDIAFEPNRRGNLDWARVKYSFETHNGRNMSDEMRRFTSEVRHLSPGKQVQVLYAEQWPQINLPLPGFQNTGFLIAMGLLCLAFEVHLTLFLARYWNWRRRAALAAAES